MLVLSRKRDEWIVIGEGPDQVRVMVVDVRGDKVRLGFEAAAHVQIHRQEVYDAIHKEKEADGNAKLKRGDDGDEMVGDLYGESVV